jgi:hypothetical protein
VNDAIGGATSGTLNLTQTARGGFGGGIIGTSAGNAIILLPMQLVGMYVVVTSLKVPQPQRLTRRTQLPLLPALVLALVGTLAA